LNEIINRAKHLEYEVKIHYQLNNEYKDKMELLKGECKTILVKFKSITTDYQNIRATMETFKLDELPKQMKCVQKSLLKHCEDILAENVELGLQLNIVWYYFYYALKQFNKKNILIKFSFLGTNSFHNPLLLLVGVMCV